jgi:hypothetical protein
MSFDFSGFEIASSEAQQFVGAVAGVLIVAAILIVLINIVLYVLKSLGLYAIATRRGIACAWLVWLPVGCEWITASLADQYRKVTSGKATIRRFIIVVLAVISIGLTSITTTTVSDKTDDILELVEHTAERSGFVDEEDALAFVGGFFEELSEIVGDFTLIAALAGVVAFASNVYWFVCAGDVYASCCPKNGTMMLVLSIFMPILAPFFFFCNKEKDAGMVPANKPQPQHVAPAEPTAPVYEAPVQQSVYEAPAQPIYEEPAQTPVEPWAASDTRPEPWENPEN